MYNEKEQVHKSTSDCSVTNAVSGPEEGGGVGEGVAIAQSSIDWAPGNFEDFSRESYHQTSLTKWGQSH